MQPHFFIDSCQGTLFDTRDPNWVNHPLRKNYARHHRRIETVADFKATLRGGQCAWPGGYPLFLLTSDGGCLHFDCARENARQIIDSIQRGANDGWRCVACDVNYEDSQLLCDHCSDPIECAYEP